MAADPSDAIAQATADFQKVALAAQLASTQVAQASMVTAAITGTNASSNEVAKATGNDLRQAGKYTG
ncbi:MAG TPA: hypothetical protein VF169_15380 [Albitalea sp.]|uniref:hypothetical protein n=1 Tax=Piscinibacter sp. TaxID=1903157 RepID=UPI002ED4778E